ncbi:TlpA family protein disulfide reductase [Solitalea canadensis]|uniref:Thiol-disulfide isomerase-like thioredoxin n=1 Tax=Solitalea canadensis (strain ATCC 29591 / DSM 3403 / JCM 21819 / LMG 8368 / NBRC 15130 / NCIMB 12057 / USAM 9D) TaxID=929556 RepID=H8KWU6_SOLCM|nr:TlpA disulfide reductase family protein [Solitalea canadensis]AFD08275.1 thiol-disulfide isomerase-like thioredoxin [Solitalea canadensis DSM 3403]
MNVKKCLAASLFLLTTMSGVKAQNLSEIKGKLDMNRPEPVKLFKVMEGRMEEVAISNPSKNGYFGFIFQPEYKGFYVVGVGEAISGMKNKYKFYFQGNDKLSLILNDSTYTLAGENSKENKLLTDWHNVVQPVEYNAINVFRQSYKEFFPILTKVADQSATWMKGKSSGNKEFDRLLAQTINYDVAFYAMGFLKTPRTIHPSKEDYNDYLKNFHPADYLSNLELLKYPYGTRVLGQLAYFNRRDDKDVTVDKVINAIPNDQLKGEFALENAGYARSFTNYLELVDKYGKYFLTEDQKRRSQAIGAKLASFKPTEKAINFTYPDINEKQVSLTDFKGKLVLVDVWATWCGPCKKEIPALKKLEEELRGKDVVFMSVSVDQLKDKEKWKDFVSAENLVGVQLFAGASPDIMTNYQIKGIPRFMLFDKKGNIINVDAPRPSEPKLKETILEWLNKS